MDLQQYLKDERQRLIADENYHRQQKEEHERKELEASIQRKYLEERIASLLEQFPKPSKSSDASSSQPVGASTITGSNKGESSAVAPSSVEIIPDELRRTEFQDMSLIDVAVKIASTLNTSFTADDVVDKVYKISNEDERKACKRSFSASLSRAALDGLLTKVKRGTFVRKDLVAQTEEVMNGLFSN